jgi:cytochrome c peroxidase
VRVVNTARVLVVAALMAALAGCGDEEGLSGAGGGASSSGSGGGAIGAWDWALPLGVPAPAVPADNPMSTTKVELGRRLFHDKRLSGNETYSCATCHVQERAFTDGRAHALGSTGQVHPRGSMSLANVAYAARLTWANPLIDSLEQQALLPMLGEAPVELGLAGKEPELLARLAAEPVYRELFPAAFPGESHPVSLVNVTRALATFERTILSFRSPYDRYAYGGDRSALSVGALRGRDLFFSDEVACFRCHGGFALSDAVVRDGGPAVVVEYHNTGLYNLDGKGAYPPDNTGVFTVSGLPADMGRFRAPTLRNIAVTAPYMHDGSVATLEGAIDHYAAGGRTIATGPDAGDGSKSPLKSALVKGFSLTPLQRRDLLDFFASLTDEELLNDPRLSDPWSQTP